MSLCFPRVTPRLHSTPRFHYRTDCLKLNFLLSTRTAPVLSAHPPCSGAIHAIPFGTGSLGHGLGLACGIAFSCRFTGKSLKVFAVLSDGDCNEGSTWEAALFASQQKLSALTVVVDLNGVQGIGYTKNILNLEPIVDKWTSFGFAVAVADDGNDFGSLSRAHEAVKNSAEPRCIIARTVKGHGISLYGEPCGMALFTDER